MLITTSDNSQFILYATLNIQNKFDSLSAKNFILQNCEISRIIEYKVYSEYFPLKGNGKTDWTKTNNIVGILKSVNFANSFYAYPGAKKWKYRNWFKTYGERLKQSLGDYMFNDFNIYQITINVTNPNVKDKLVKI